MKLGGFDEEYRKGISYDDNDFLCKILKARLPISERDDLIVFHQVHEKDDFRTKNRFQLWTINRNYFVKKWGKFGAENTIMG